MFGTVSLKKGIRLDRLTEYHKSIAVYDKATDELLPNYHVAYQNKTLSFASIGNNELALACYNVLIDYAFHQDRISFLKKFYRNFLIFPIP